MHYIYILASQRNTLTLPLDITTQPRSHRTSPELRMAPGGFASIALARMLSGPCISSRAANAIATTNTSPECTHNAPPDSTTKPHTTKHVSFELASSSTAPPHPFHLEGGSTTAAVISREPPNLPAQQPPQPPQIYSPTSAPIATTTSESAAQSDSPAWNDSPHSPQQRPLVGYSGQQNLTRFMEAARECRRTGGVQGAAERFESVLDRDLKKKRRVETERLERAVWW